MSCGCAGADISFDGAGAAHFCPREATRRARSPAIATIVLPPIAPSHHAGRRIAIDKDDAPWRCRRPRCGPRRLHHGTSGPVPLLRRIARRGHPLVRSPNRRALRVLTTAQTSAATPAAATTVASAAAAAASPADRAVVEKFRLIDEVRRRDRACEATARAGAADTLPPCAARSSHLGIWAPATRKCPTCSSPSAPTRRWASWWTPPCPLTSSWQRCAARACRWCAWAGRCAAFRTPRHAAAEPGRCAQRDGSADQDARDGVQGAAAACPGAARSLVMAHLAAPRRTTAEQDRQVDDWHGLL